MIFLASFFQTLSWAFWGFLGRMMLKVGFLDFGTFLQGSEKYSCQPRKCKADLCMTNRRFWFHFHFCNTYSFEGKIRTLEPLLIQRSSIYFLGWQLSFKSWLRKFEIKISKFNDRHWPNLNVLKRSNWEFEKKMSLDSPVSPKDAKKCLFFCTIFLVLS